MSGPCKGCTTETGRAPGCQSRCDVYLEWNEKHQALKQKIRQAKKADQDIRGYHRDDNEKMRRRNG